MNNIVRIKMISKNYVARSAIITLFLLFSALCVSAQENDNQKIQTEERFKPRASVSMIIEREFEGQCELLLQLRKDTGWMDGMWDFAACGHLEKNETLLEAAIRETKEELDIDVDRDNVEFIYLGSNFVEGKNTTYCCCYFKINEFEGTPKIGEPEKCEQIKWFNVKRLPENMIPMQQDAYNSYRNGIIYGEYGWK